MHYMNTNIKKILGRFAKNYQHNLPKIINIPLQPLENLCKYLQNWPVKMKKKFQKKGQKRKKLI